MLVSRYPGRIKRSRYDLWYPALAPSEHLLQKWKRRETTWKNFEAEYRKEISRSDNAQAHLDTLREISQSISNPNPGFITLLCFEVETNPHCHRHILKNIIEGK